MGEVVASCSTKSGQSRWGSWPSQYPGEEQKLELEHSPSIWNMPDLFEVHHGSNVTEDEWVSGQIICDKIREEQIQTMKDFVVIIKIFAFKIYLLFL